MVTNGLELRRYDLIQEIIDTCKFSRYLEIGCKTGKSFLPIRCKYKLAVDPKFTISRKYLVKQILKNPGNLRNRFFSQTSNDFFTSNRAIFDRLGGIDVVLVDGLHTYKAALSDALNSLEHLNKDGVIVLHDCLPPNETAALPTKQFPTPEEQRTAEGWDGTWCGGLCPDLS